MRDVTHTQEYRKSYAVMSHVTQYAVMSHVTQYAVMSHVTHTHRPRQHTEIESVMRVITNTHVSQVGCSYRRSTLNQSRHHTWMDERERGGERERYGEKVDTGRVVTHT